MIEMEKANVEAVKEYLEEKFPECQIVYEYKPDFFSYIFFVHNNSKPFKLRIREKFMENTKDIKSFLRYKKVAEALKNLGEVLINRDGEIKPDEGQN
jgi:hypothetical protein